MKTWKKIIMFFLSLSLKKTTSRHFRFQQSLPRKEAVYYMNESIRMQETLMHGLNLCTFNGTLSGQIQRLWSPRMKLH